MHRIVSGIGVVVVLARCYRPPFWLAQCFWGMICAQSGGAGSSRLDQCGSAAAFLAPMQQSLPRSRTSGPPQKILTALFFANVVCVFLVCAALTGCIGVTPLPKATRTPQKTEIKTVDLGFLQPGHTTRAEVSEKLKLIDTGYKSDRFFLGRWSSSSMGGWAYIVGLGGGVGNASRFWKSGNLMVEFTEHGVVQNYKTFDDGHLLKELGPVVALAATLTGEPHQMDIKYFKDNYGQVPARLTLTASTFVFEELGTGKKAYKFTLPAQEVVRLTTSAAQQNDPDPVYTMHTLHFARSLRPLGGPRGKTIQLEVDTPGLVQLLSFIAHSSKETNKAN